MALGGDFARGQLPHQPHDPRLQAIFRDPARRGASQYGNDCKPCMTLVVKCVELASDLPAPVPARPA